MIENSNLWGDIVVLGILFFFTAIGAFIGSISTRGIIPSGQRCIPVGQTYEILNEVVYNWSPGTQQRRIFIIRDKNGELRSFWINPGEDLRRFCFVSDESGRRFLVPRDPSDVLFANSIPYL